MGIGGGTAVPMDAPTVNDGTPVRTFAPTVIVATADNDAAINSLNDGTTGGNDNSSASFLSPSMIVASGVIALSMAMGFILR